MQRSVGTIRVPVKGQDGEQRRGDFKGHETISSITGPPVQSTSLRFLLKKHCQIRGTFDCVIKCINPGSIQIWL